MKMTRNYERSENCVNYCTINVLKNSHLKEQTKKVLKFLIKQIQQIVNI